MKHFIDYLFDLQLFADPANYVNKTTDTAATTGNDLSAEMKTYYDMRLIDEAGPNLVHQQFGQKRPIPKGSGKTIEFRKFSKLPKATTPITEGVTPEGKKLSASAVTATVAQYGDYVVQSDVLELTALDNTILEATKLLGQQAGLTLDTVVRDILMSGTNVSYADSVTSSSTTEITDRFRLNTTCKLTVDMVEQVVTKLKAQNAPTINGYYVAIVHPHVVYDLRRDPEWIDAHKYAQPDELYNGEIGQIAGVRFVESTEAKIIRGADLATTRNLSISAAVTGGADVHALPFKGGTAPASSLVGRKIIVRRASDSKLFQYTVTANTTGTITTQEAVTENFAVNDIIYPGEGSATGGAVYCCLFLGDGAYGVTEVEGGGLQTIVKQKGSAGSADPLDQRSSIGWKAMITAKILVDAYMVRLECCSKYSDTAVAN